MSKFYDDDYPTLSSQHQAAAARHSAYVTQMLADDSVPQAAKILHTGIIPAKDTAAFTALVESGQLRADMCGADCAHPLASPLSQVLSMGEPERTSWLSSLLRHYDGDAAALKIASYYSGSHTTRLAGYTEGSHRIGHDSLVYHLQTRCGMNLFQIAQIDGRLLAAQVKNGDVMQPLLFNLLANAQLTLDNLDTLAASAGNADFLLAADAQGQTLFMRLASHYGYREHAATLDCMSWMLMHHPHLVNQQDRLGWTPLDRYIAAAARANEARGESTLLRMLVAGGAEFNRQVAPGFNLAEAVEARKSPLRHKPTLSRNP